MDSIWNSAFGLDIDCQNNPENQYFTRTSKFIQSTSKMNPTFFISGKSFH